MTVDAGRYIEPFAAFQVNPGDTPVELIGAVEGVAPVGELTVQMLMATENLLVLRVTRSKGLIDNLHKHDDHETVATLVSGRLKNIIGDQEFIAEAGATWRHPPGVVHGSEALEDCVQIEIKTPPHKTWTAASPIPAGSKA